MRFRLSAAALAVSCAFPLSSMAADVVGDTVVVSASRIETPDVDATYASEVHTREDIARSGAASLVDYLTRNSSLQVRPNYGNRFSPGIDMRGYGLGDGYQNVVVSVDGRRLNNIDMVPQLLGAIPLRDIERIEITKGSGSVIYGDGAMAGTIQIVTRPRSGASMGAYAGSHGTRGVDASVGHASERFSVSASVDHSNSDGMSDKDPSGHRDRAEGNTWKVTATGRPADVLELSADVAHSYIDNRYVGSLTNAQFRNDPGQNKGSNYTWQQVESDVWGVGAKLKLSAAWTLSYRHWGEDRESNFLTYSSISRYDTDADEVSVHYKGTAYDVVAGVQRTDGMRESVSSGNETTKKNLAYFVQVQKVLDALTLSAGARRENVDYTYAPAAGASLNADHDLTGWDLGANYRLSSALTVFGNYNSAYQAPDIDRFFKFGGSFNGFIEPARVKTLTVGLNHVTAANRLKVSLFHARLKNEIYLDPFTYDNTNIDRSHKYGLEVQDTWQIQPAFAAFVNYAWVRAKIDAEERGSGAFNGKDLPGVPAHSLLVGGDWTMSERSSLRLSHTWRSQTWAIGDFDNNNSQKQGAYNSTDVAYRYRLKDVGLKNLEFVASVNNLFDARNGVWVRDDAIYPIDFTRTWRLGVRASF
ncbi:TonB-dependent receptor [Denitromonas sp.]|uniref:TonB-dependent receptor n=1 Tax=Denitromonas sp. TaxID=2734609 RepID=UPI003A896206